MQSFHALITRTLRRGDRAHTFLRRVLSKLLTRLHVRPRPRPPESHPRTRATSASHRCEFRSGSDRHPGAHGEARMQRGCQYHPAPAHGPRRRHRRAPGRHTAPPLGQRLRRAAGQTHRTPRRNRVEGEHLMSPAAPATTTPTLRRLPILWPRRLCETPAGSFRPCPSHRSF